MRCPILANHISKFFKNYHKKEKINFIDVTSVVQILFKKNLKSIQKVDQKNMLKRDIFKMHASRFLSRSGLTDRVISNSPY